MNLISIISFIICILVVLSTLRPNADVFSPGRLFTFIWALAIGLTNLKFSGFQHEWSTEIWLQVLIGPLSFLIGVLLVYSINLDKEIYSIKAIRSEKNLYHIDKDKLYLAVIILFLLFLFAYIVIYIKAGGVTLFSANPGKIRREFTMFGIGLFLHNVLLVVFFTTIYYLLEKKNKIKRRILLFTSISSLVLYGITLQRYQIFITLFLVIVLLYYHTYKIKFRFIFLFAVVVVIFFFIVSSFRAGEILFYVLYRISKMKFSPEYAVLTEPYMYVVMNLENYARSIAKNEFFTFGYYTFDFVTALGGIKHWISNYFNLVETPYLVSIYNTYSAFWNFYRDFGLVGIFFIPFLGGLAFSSLYYSFRKQPTLLKIGIYSMFLFAVIFSFFNSIIGFLWFVYNLFVLIIVLKYINPAPPKEIR
jgi:oligosaccharide repeat unit polymerase